MRRKPSRRPHLKHIVCGIWVRIGRTPSWGMQFRMRRLFGPVL